MNKKNKNLWRTLTFAKTAPCVLNTIEIPNRLSGDFGGGISTSVPDGKNISIL
jgi:hypothetical protein